MIPLKVAVCVLRVESRGEGGVLITVTTTSDVRMTAPGRVQSVAGPDEALFGGPCVMQNGGRLEVVRRELGVEPGRELARLVEAGHGPGRGGCRDGHADLN